MDEPAHIHPEQFFDFVEQAGLALVFVSVHPAHAFNRSLARSLTEANQLCLAMGTVSLVELLASGATALAFLRQCLHQAGIPRWLDVMPGYYLFRGGQLLAFDSGLPAAEDAKPIVRESLLGAVLSAVTRSPVHFADALLQAAEQASAKRLSRLFVRAVREPSPRGGRVGAQSVDELMEAYRVLEVRPDASDDEIRRSWRRLRVAFHPDVAASDPVEFMRRSEMSARINRALEIIEHHRRPSGRRTAC